MSRARWKGPYISYNVIKPLLNTHSQEVKKKVIKIWSRASTILPIFVGKKVQIYNGKRFVPKIISENMIGHKFGEFSFSRQNYSFKKTKIKKKRK